MIRAHRLYGEAAEGDLEDLDLRMLYTQVQRALNRYELVMTTDPWILYYYLTRTIMSRLLDCEQPDETNFTVFIVVGPIPNLLLYSLSLASPDTNIILFNLKSRYSSLISVVLGEIRRPFCAVVLQSDVPSQDSNPDKSRPLSTQVRRRQC